jgi:hypothetical protein
VGDVSNEEESPKKVAANKMKKSPNKTKQAPKPSPFDNPHKNHKINQVISLANEFLQETFLRTND